MAHMYPSRPVFSGGGHVAERRLFEALRDGLDDEHFVYHQLRYVHEDTEREGEANVIILLPSTPRTHAVADANATSPPPGRATACS